MAKDKKKCIKIAAISSYITDHTTHWDRWAMARRLWAAVITVKNDRYNGQNDRYNGNSKNTIFN